MRPKLESWDIIDNSSPVIIHWVRHAESCSNVELTELDSDMDAQTIVQSVSTKLLQKTSQPPLSELGMFQAIEFGKFINEDYSDYFCSQSVRTILTLMLGLESKYKNLVQDPIYINIVSDITEILNPANYLNQDKQNEAVPEENLKQIIYYLRKWLNENYFNFFSNIDKNFIDLCEYIKGIVKGLIQTSQTKQILDLFEDIDKCIGVNAEERKKDLLARCINLINTSIEKSHISKELIDRLVYYIKPDRFDFIKFRFIDIPGRNLQATKLDQMNNFINWLIENYGGKKVLCVSHGSLLKTYFNIPRKLFNTEMLEQRGFMVSDRRATLIENPRLVSRENIHEYPGLLDQIQKCEKICGSPQYFKSTHANKLFGLIGKMSISNDPITDNEINPKFNIDTFESIYTNANTSTASALAEPKDKYFIKYLKYKSKYEKLKKQLI